MNIRFSWKKAIGLVTVLTVVLATRIDVLAAVVNEVEPNDSIAGAQVLAPASFTLDYSPDIGDTAVNTSESIPHVTIIGTGNNTFDYYSVTISSAPARLIFDVDYGVGSGGSMDSFLDFYDPSGTWLTSNDDVRPSSPPYYDEVGQGGSFAEQDSYLEYTVSAPGTYTIRVGRWLSGSPPPDYLGAPINAGSTYTLQVSVENLNTAPTCNAGTDISAQCDGVQLNASASDAEGQSLTYSWGSSCAGTTFTPTADVLNPTATFGSSCGVSCVLTLTVDDGNGGTCTDTVNVSVDDVTAPTPRCQNISVALVANGAGAGIYTLQASETDNGSDDNCGPVTLAIPSTVFTCTDVGQTVPVTLTVADACSNSDTCTAQVTVTDPNDVCCDAPVAACKDVILSLGQDGTGSITPADVDNGSTADCGLASLAVTPNSFTCDDFDVGGGLETPIPVNLTVTDVYGVTDTCTATLYLGDSLAPQMDCPVDVILNNDPGECGAVYTYAISAVDNCSAVAITRVEGLPSGSLFPVGSTTVRHRATDADNNTAECTFTVTVLDTAPPVAQCQDITVILGGGGPADVEDVEISGVINQYGAVTAIGADWVEVDNAAAFNVEDKVLVIQMKGAEIDLTNTGSFGDVSSIGNAGNFEYARIGSIAGAAITFQAPLVNAYDPGGVVQLVRVPEYNNVTVTGPLTATDWNGAIGGVLAFDALGAVTLNAGLDVTGKGFRGGLPSGNYYSGCENRPEYFYAQPTGFSGQKGEGIVDAAPGYGAGRGKLANGGGGANVVNHGGGGGANAGAGGAGGQWQGCVNGTQGIGGAPLASFVPAGKIFLGGGGGGGQQNNNATPPGGDGGGIILINAASIDGNGYGIAADGQIAATAGGDGASGSGAGGTILIKADSIDSAVQVRADGARGGHAAPNHGAGGGGGGGMIWISASSLPANMTVSTVGGAPGIASPYDPAAAGQGGTVLLDLELPGTADVVPVTIDVTEVDAGSTDNCGIAGVSLSQTEFTCDDVGTVNVVLTVTDVNGLVSTCDAVVTVQDNTLPTIACPADILAASDPDQCGTAVTYTPPVGIDECPGAVTTQISGLGPGATFPVGDTIETYRVTDASGNSASCSFTVTVEDTTAPTIDCPASIAAGTDPGICAAQVTVPQPLVQDNCGSGYALDFDGVNDWVDIAPTSANSPEQALTVEAWVNVRIFQEWGGIVDNGVWTGYDREGYTLFTKADGRFHIMIGNPATGAGDHVQFASANIYPTGEWLHVALVYDHTEARLYVNGVLDNSAAYSQDLGYTGVLANPEFSYHIGRFRDHNELYHFNGQISDVRIWDLPRSQTQLQANMNVNLTGNEPGLVSYYRFTGGPGAAAVLDQTANGHDGVLINMDLATDWVPSESVNGVSLENDYTGTEDASATYPLGTTVVTFTATDAADNSATCSMTVTVQDLTPPTAVCQNITVQIEPDLDVAITAADIDNGSSDNCPGVSLAITSGPTTFNCDVVGQTFVVTLTATDAAGLTGTCTANVTVADDASHCNDPPDAVCTPLTIPLGPDGTITIAGSQVDGGSSDPDGDPITLSVTPNAFDCSHVGTLQTVTLTVSDDLGATDTCTTTVTVTSAGDCEALRTYVMIEMCDEVAGLTRLEEVVALVDAKIAEFLAGSAICDPVLTLEQCRQQLLQDLNLIP